MKDSDFKQMKHQIGNNSIATNGTAISLGYKPDLTLKNGTGEIVFILESEQKTDRKAFIGDIIKAEKFAQESNCSPTLIIVMREFSNTTVKQIAAHLQSYLKWLFTGFGESLKIRNVLVISDKEYEQSRLAAEIIGSPGFLSRGVKVNLM